MFSSVSSVMYLHLLNNEQRTLSEIHVCFSQPVTRVKKCTSSCTYISKYLRSLCFSIYNSTWSSSTAGILIYVIVDGATSLQSLSHSWCSTLPQILFSCNLFHSISTIIIDNMDTTALCWPWPSSELLPNLLCSTPHTSSFLRPKF